MRNQYLIHVHHVSGVLSGDDASLFLLELQLTQNGIIVLNKTGAEFFLRDFNLKKKTLWVCLPHLQC